MLTTNEQITKGAHTRIFRADWPEALIPNTTWHSEMQNHSLSLLLFILLLDYNEYCLNCLKITEYAKEGELSIFKVLET